LNIKKSKRGTCPIIVNVLWRNSPVYYLFYVTNRQDQMVLRTENVG